MFRITAAAMDGAIGALDALPGGARVNGRFLYCSTAGFRPRGDVFKALRSRRSVSSGVESVGSGGAVKKGCGCFADLAADLDLTMGVSGNVCGGQLILLRCAERFG